MFVFDDDFVERTAKTTGLSEWQIRHAANKLITAGLVQAGKSPISIDPLVACVIESGSIQWFTPP
jgi:hypothetical protein